MACGIENGNSESPPEFGDEFLKIVVIGEPKCGKTTFIRACVKDNFEEKETSINGVRVYPCKFEVDSGEARPVALYEIPGHPGFVEAQLKPHYENADIFVFMYAIDDPSSLEKLSNKWIPETSFIMHSKVAPVALVGNKKDLRHNQQVIERLALNNQVPVTPEQTVGLIGLYIHSSVTIEVSSYDSYDVLQAFTNICNLIVGFD